MSGQTDGYFAIGNKVLSGERLFNGRNYMNARFCRVEKDGKITSYTPYEVSEYGFLKGASFKSFTVSINNDTTRYFLERLASGKINLYSLRLKDLTKFYITDRNDSALIEISSSKAGYISLFENITTDCPQSVSKIPFVKFKRNSLKRYILDYNNCADNPFPRFRYGVSIGLTSTKLSAVDSKSAYSIPDYGNELSLAIGAFLDVPLYTSNFSFHPELYFKRISTSKSFMDNSLSYDLVNNYTSVSLPLFLRYSKLTKKIIPFIQAGPVYTRAIRNNSALFEYESANNNIYINITNSPILQMNMGGLAIGGGVILKNRLFSEIRYSKLYNLQHENKLLNYSEIFLGIGYFF